MRVKTQVKGGKLASNHNTTVRRTSPFPKGTEMKIKSQIKTGRLSANHNTTVR